jgi:hypothetical protein
LRLGKHRVQRPEFKVKGLQLSNQLIIQELSFVKWNQGRLRLRPDDAFLESRRTLQDSVFGNGTVSVLQ